MLEETTKVAQPPEPTPKPDHIKEIGEFERTSEGSLLVIPYGNQYAHVGYLLDMWAELVTGQAEKAGDFWNNVDNQINSISPLVSCRYRNLSATGLFVPFRKTVFVRRNPVTIVIYIATQGQTFTCLGGHLYKPK